jgi:hypothetical protein
VLWAGVLSGALLVGAGTAALAAGAFAEPPVDHAGSFESINVHGAASSTTTASNGTEAGAPSTTQSNAASLTSPAAGVVTEPASDALVPATSSAKMPTTPTSSRDAADSPEHEHEPPEHEPRDD